MKLVECVPNFSEGRDADKIRAIAGEVERTAGVKLLDVDPGESTNRTVVTFVGPPEAVAEGAFAAIRKAAEVIDMRTQRGAHSRIGATDVCPFVPVSGVTMDECVELARSLGRRVAEELHIPVYLYEEAASRAERRNLASIRAGEYEGLAEKLRDPAWAPDFAAPFNARSGATVIGAREFLIAYNINLNTRDRRLAHEIALNLRESGRARRDAQGEIIRDAAGQAVQEPGRFPHVKAVGWYVEDHGCAQISINFTNFKVTPVHVVFDEAAREADRLGLRVTGSELVGLIPEEALLAAGRHYLVKQGKSPGAPDAELVGVAVRSLGLGDVVAFDAAKKIIERRVCDSRPSLVKLDVRGFADEVSMDSPAPGGGSVAALCGALSAALSAMVANLTVGKKGYEAAAQDMRDLALRAQRLKDEMLRAVDDDTRAFDAVMAASRMPKSAPEREAALERASQQATLVPLAVLETCVDLLELAERAVEHGNRNSLSDAGVAALVAEAAATGAWYNVRINLPGIRDDAFTTDARRRAQAAQERATALAARVRARVEKSLG